MRFALPFSQMLARLKSEGSKILPNNIETLSDGEVRSLGAIKREPGRNPGQPPLLYRGTPGRTSIGP